MTGAGMVGALAVVAVGAVMWARVLRLGRAPLPTEPHRFDPSEGVRFLGTARVDGHTAGWPRGELVLDRDCLLVRAPRAGDTPAELLVRRCDVRSVSVQGGILSRRVAVEARGSDRRRAAEMRFGAAMSDPAGALRHLGWPVGPG